MAKKAAKKKVPKKAASKKKAAAKKATAKKVPAKKASAMEDAPSKAFSQKDAPLTHLGCVLPTERTLRSVTLTLAPKARREPKSPSYFGANSKHQPMRLAS
jgi:hypothetical protein